MASTNDIRFMKQAIKLSKKGYGFVNPNPLVGAVIVRNGKIIGRGYHASFGGPHAEINAINNSKGSLKGSTIYVTMEPCNHFGKTPPCTERLIKEQFERVVVGMNDPNEMVNGQGIRILEKAGIKVNTGVLNEEITKMNEGYIKYITTNLPFCTMKTAMTLDGKISTYTGDSKWISNEESRKCVHDLRHRHSAIMVGVNTIIKDDPLLTDRSGFKKKSNPIRVIVDSTGRIPLSSNVLKAKDKKTIVAVTKKVKAGFIESMKSKNVRTIVCPEKNNRVDLIYLIKKLGKQGIDSILLEGGSTLNFSAIQDGIVDKVYSFISPKMFGGDNANTPLGGIGFEKVDEAITLNISDIKRFDNDLMIEAYIIKK